MPLLTFRDRLPADLAPRRVLVAGTSGSGKTTLAARLAGELGIVHIEIDGLYHGPNWTPQPSFEADVEAFSAEPAWVTEWQYGQARALLADRAALVVWLDLPRSVVMRQVVRRTLARRWRRQPLWNGNIEPPLHTILTDPEHIVRWAWTTHHKSARRIADLQRIRPELAIVRLGSHAEAEAWVIGPLRSAIERRGA